MQILTALLWAGAIGLASADCNPGDFGCNGQDIIICNALGVPVVTAHCDNDCVFAYERTYCI